MQKIVGIIFLFLSISAYSQEVVADSVPSSILELEQEVTSAFLSQRNFHLGLEAEIGFNFTYPYDSLQFYFFDMKHYADSAILARMSWNAANAASLGEIEQNMHRYLKQAKVSLANYQSILLRHQISRVDAFEMLELVGKELYNWQEKMMSQGRELGVMKRDLDSKFDRKTQKDEYRKRYQPISSAESIFKQTQSYLTQLENLYSRFESANGESVYYIGPSIVAKPEQEAFQLTIDLLEVGQSEFEMHLKEFRQLMVD